MKLLTSIGFTSSSPLRTKSSVPNLGGDFTIKATSRLGFKEKLSVMLRWIFWSDVITSKCFIWIGDLVIGNTSSSSWFSSLMLISFTCIRNCISFPLFRPSFSCNLKTPTLVAPSGRWHHQVVKWNIEI